MSPQPEDKTLYVALFTNPKPKEYHWGIYAKTTASDASPETFYHVTNRQGGWKFEPKTKYDFTTSMSGVLLLKIGTLGSTMTSQALEGKLEAVRVSNGDPNFTCRTWVKEALRKLNDDHIITCNDIDALEKEAVNKAHEYRPGVEQGKGTWGLAISAYSK